MTAIIEQLLLVAILAVAATGLALTIRARRKTASRLEALSDTVSILIKTSYHNSKQLRESGDLLKNVHSTSLESLAFQRKAHDHQRVLMASLSRQAAQIGQMLGGAENVAEAQGGDLRAASDQPVKLPRRAGFRMAPVIGNGQARRVGTVPLASLLTKAGESGARQDIPVQKNTNVVAVEQLFSQIANTRQPAAGGSQAEDYQAGSVPSDTDRLAAELLGGTDMNQIKAQKVANG